MNPEAPDDDRTVIQPHGPGPATGFEKTQWSPGNALPTAFDKTQIGTAPVADDMGGNLPVGTRLAEFEITSLIGEGGFGIVYLAHDHLLERRVALKEYMPSSLAARSGGSQVQVKSERHRETFEAGLKSFVNEARLLASFDHQSLVKVYRFWEANGTAYMVMPFLEGKTLKDVLKTLGQRPDEAWLLAVLGPLTEALLVIHAAQCYHRDIAPDNVMLLPQSQRWLLLDFGAARRVIGDMTQALTVILKPGYAPVEQYAEIPGMRQGPWTDVYALAAVVYFAIMGKTPPPSVGRLLNDTYVPLTQAAAGRYSEPFLAAIDRALVVRPEQRTQTIGELRRELGLGAAPAASDRPPRTAPPPPPAAPPAGEIAPPASAAAALPAQGSSRGLLLAGAAVAVAALVVGGYALFAPKPAPAPLAVQAAAPAPAPAAAPASAPAAVAAPAAAPAPFDVSQQFADLVKAQAPGFDVQVQTSKTRYRIGQDNFSLSFKSEREGYPSVFIYGADGVLLQLYPTIKQGAVKVKKGQTVQLPPAGVDYPTTGPAGPTDVLVLVSTRQRDHGALKPRADGDVRVFPAGAEAAALAAAWPGPGPVLAGRAVCPGEGACDDTFGAAVLRVQVVAP